VTNNYGNLFDIKASLKDQKNFVDLAEMLLLMLAVLAVGVLLA
jgi:hypothetical protein